MGVSGRAEASRAPGARHRVRPGRRGVRADGLPDLPERRRVRRRRAGDGRGAGRARSRSGWTDEGVAAFAEAQRGRVHPAGARHCWCWRRSTPPRRSATTCEVGNDDVRARIDELLGDDDPEDVYSQLAAAGHRPGGRLRERAAAAGPPGGGRGRGRRPRRSTPPPCGPGTRRSARSSAEIVLRLHHRSRRGDGRRRCWPQLDRRPGRLRRRRPRSTRARTRCLRWSPAAPTRSRRCWPRASRRPQPEHRLRHPGRRGRWRRRHLRRGPGLPDLRGGAARAGAGGRRRRRRGRDASWSTTSANDLGVTVNPRFGVLEDGGSCRDGGVVDILEDERRPTPRQRPGPPRPSRAGAGITETDRVPVALVVTVSSRLPGLLGAAGWRAVSGGRAARRPARRRGHRRRAARRGLGRSPIVPDARRRGRPRRRGRRPRGAAGGHRHRRGGGRRAGAAPGPGCSTSSRSWTGCARPGGCPWDAEQTHASLRGYLLEEAHEAYDAIVDDDPVAMREELGDVLLQVVFHARVAAEAAPGRRFDIDDVAGDLVDKLVRRHPHVFGDAGPRDVAQVEAGWEEIKQAEKQRRSPTEGCLALAAGRVLGGGAGAPRRAGGAPHARTGRALRDAAPRRWGSGCWPSSRPPSSGAGTSRTRCARRSAGTPGNSTPRRTPDPPPEDPRVWRSTRVSG